MLGTSIFALLASLPFTVYGAWIPQRRATVCNGQAALCSRSYGNVTVAGSHDSYAISGDPFALARNQEISITSQLNLGVRMLQAQAHLRNNVIHFCHTSERSFLLFDGGPVVDYLTEVKTWLDANPNEVVTFLFTNPEGLSISSVWAPAFASSGIDQLAYVPPHVPMKRTEWPTLGSMIDSGKRVVVFLDSGADGSVDYILPEFEMIWEPPFDSTDSTFPCSVDRTAGPLATGDHMYLLNHFLDVNLLGTGILISDPAAAPTTNGVNSILANTAGCQPLGGGLNPTFVLMDFVNLGNGIGAVNKLNGF
ncbi:PLC-like phosphodiesterase [Vararia minispora EC-137]|uniref:PLC-like phosphodiesterase n=1 Tax=Vararia minispora EC-137 TaxID=1314806 RepID=A0ACB8QMM8_9AGAM|nr:PLC-like phosphodiesterase [Vararia minispora EC-137]